MADHTQLMTRLKQVLPPGGLLCDGAAKLVYSRDSSHMDLGRPLAVALPKTAAQVAQVVQICAQHHTPIVCRGSGTGLAGGALPCDGSLVLSLAGLTDLSAFDSAQRLVYSGAGVINEQVSVRGQAQGLHFAPDPSSQSATTIGGNIATNAGGPHCLAHGVTLHHLRRLDWLDALGRPWTTGTGVAGERGFDLTSLLCGSEGTLGVVTGALLQLTPNPSAESTLLSFFPRLSDATDCVVQLLGSGLLPVAVEIVDQAMLLSVEEAFGFGFPTDVAAAMITEFAGPQSAVDEDGRRAQELFLAGGASEVRLAADTAERFQLWQCRKKAFGAIGRLAPRYVTMDVVVPIGRLSDLVRRIQEIRDQCRVSVATAFHAGDGNLHPGVHYDDQDPQESQRAHQAADLIIKKALALGGSATGEHGVGVEKRHAIPWQMDRQTAEMLHCIKALFDPQDLLNPGKLHPDPKAEYARPKPPVTDVVFDWASLTVSAPADAAMADIQQVALARGFWIPVGLFTGDPPDGPGIGWGGTVAQLVAHLLPGPTLLAGGHARHVLLELWAETGDGQTLHLGAPVFKNVAGYGLAQALCGSGDMFARTQAATFQLKPIAQQVRTWRLSGAQVSSAVPDLQKHLFHLDQTLAGPTLVVSPDQVTIFAAGRDRDWDLNALDRDLTTGAWCKHGTWSHQRTVDFAEAGQLICLDILPAWALSSDDWTCMSPRPDAESSFGLPPQTTRAIWQASTQHWWCPETGATPDDWVSDIFFRGGRIVSPAAPTPGVPMDLLYRLKTLFDPQSRLLTPDWLVETSARVQSKGAP